MRRMQERMTTSDHNMQEGFYSVSNEAQKQAERVDRIMVAAHGRDEGKMTEEKEVAKGMRNEILELLKSNREPQEGEELENRQLTIQIQAPTPGQASKIPYRVQPLDFWPLSDASRNPQRRTEDRLPPQPRVLKCWDDIPSQSSSYSEGNSQGPVRMRSQYFLIDEFEPISELRRALVDGKLGGNSQIFRANKRHG